MRGYMYILNIKLYDCNCVSWYPFFYIIVLCNCNCNIHIHITASFAIIRHAKATNKKSTHPQWGYPNILLTRLRLSSSTLTSKLFKNNKVLVAHVVILTSLQCTSSLNVQRNPTQCIHSKNSFTCNYLLAVIVIL